MWRYILLSLDGYKPSYWRDDIISGIGVAALSIPVAMGYAQVAGLPAIYGLYASCLPVLAYILFASSPQLIFGIDATTSAVTGSIILGTAGLAAGSKEAIALAPILAFFCAIFLVLFALLKLNKFTRYISAPVLSGFISGLGVSIMVSQLTKIMGLPSSEGNVLETIWYIVTQILKLNVVSFCLGVVAVVLVLLGKKILPKWPVALFVLILGTVGSYYFQIKQYGVSIVGSVPSGFPSLHLPDFTTIDWGLGILGGLISAIACFAGSLLPSESFAMRNNYAISGRRELFAYGFSNVIASLTGTAPTSASVSRTAANESFHGKTQVVSMVAATIIGIIVAFFSGVLYYMPQPVLAGIVFAALVGIVDVAMVKRLFHQGAKREANVWLLAAIGTFLFGVIWGVLLGIVLSYLNVVLRTVASPSAEVGIIEGRDGFFDISQHKEARRIPTVLLFRYSGSLFFGNVESFEKALKQMIQADTKVVMIDASAIVTVDMTASAKLKQIVAFLVERDIDYYFVNVIENLKVSFRKHDLQFLLEEEHVQKTIEDALQHYQTQQK
ncbi:SulP family inorganic anion transporter [Listeria booriae]|uniref:Sulfate transporter n=1 Tax=Listeria booriae TaxID=1552123 RepID=A0A099VYX8_9LIST|nr:SulP family inorganic anion transporter [Listeria booriae]KGL37952.1 sulfate transporter [Listeria booriae]STY45950.1 Probable sulfate transporter Rv1739c/MT1781 [Listeria booriae]